MLSKDSLYETDFYSWTKQQAILLREGKWHDLDIDNMAEEIESLGRSDKRQLTSRLYVLVRHLLKWQYQPEYRQFSSRSWTLTINEQRRGLQSLLKESPSLRPALEPALTEEFSGIRRETLIETGLLDEMLPETCPWTVEEVLDDAFWPGEPLH